MNQSCNLTNCDGRCGICAPQVPQHVCPNCGYCPCCGRRQEARPYDPWYPWTQPSPWAQPYWVDTGGTYCRAGND